LGQKDALSVVKIVFIVKMKNLEIKKIFQNEK